MNGQVERGRPKRPKKPTLFLWFHFCRRFEQRLNWKIVNVLCYLLIDCVFANIFDPNVLTFIIQNKSFWCLAVGKYEIDRPYLFIFLLTFDSKTAAGELIFKIHRSDSERNKWMENFFFKFSLMAFHYDECLILQISPHPRTASLQQSEWDLLAIKRCQIVVFVDENHLIHSVGSWQVGPCEWGG